MFIYYLNMTHEGMIQISERTNILHNKHICRFLYSDNVFMLSHLYLMKICHFS